MVKPRLPIEIESVLPLEAVRKINSFIPHTPKKAAMSGLQRELERLQKSPKKTAMFLYGLDDFVLC